MKFTMLYSDGLLFVLIVAIFWLVKTIRTNPQTAKKWRYVFQTRVGCGSFIIIAFYYFQLLLITQHSSCVIICNP